MKGLFVLVIAVASLLPGSFSLQCYSCKGRNCANAGPSQMEVETCYTGRRRQADYEGVLESTTARTVETIGGSTSAATIPNAAASSTTVKTDADASTTASTSSSTATFTTTTTTKIPCGRPQHNHGFNPFRHNSIWAPVRWPRTEQLEPVCVNATVKGFLGWTTVRRGCALSSKTRDICGVLKAQGKVRSCTSCKTDLCN